MGGYGEIDKIHKDKRTANDNVASNPRIRYEYL